MKPQPYFSAVSGSYRAHAHVIYTTIVLLTLSVFLILNSGCSIKAYTEKKLATRLPAKPLSPKEIKEDIDYYVALVEKVNPYPYFFTPKDSIVGIANRIKEINKPLDPIEFYRRFRVLQAAYNIAHQYDYNWPSPFQKFENNGGRLFPFKVGLIDNTLKVKQIVYSPQQNDIIQKGDVIISINGFKADSLFKAFTQYEAGLPEWKRINTEGAFYFYLWLNNIQAPFSILFLSNKTGKQTSIVDNGYTRNQGQINNTKKLKAAAPAINQYITFEQWNDTIAYMNFKSMALYYPDVQKQWNPFLQQTFATLKTNGTKYLFIDLSQNGGGNNKYGKELLDFISAKPFTTSSGKEWKITSEYKNAFLKLAPWPFKFLVKKQLPDVYKYKHDTTIIFPQIMTHPQDNPVRFQGKVFVIIGPGTFSSATSTASAIADFKLATLIGEPTGESPNDIGEIGYYRLPHSNISIAIPSALFTRPHGNKTDPNPVLPDIRIKLRELPFEQRKNKLIQLLNTSLSR